MHSSCRGVASEQCLANSEANNQRQYEADLLRPVTTASDRGRTQDESKDVHDCQHERILQCNMPRMHNAPHDVVRRDERRRRAERDGVIYDERHRRLALHIHPRVGHRQPPRRQLVRLDDLRPEPTAE